MDPITSDLKEQAYSVGAARTRVGAEHRALWDGAEVFPLILPQIFPLTQPLKMSYLKSSNKHPENENTPKIPETKAIYKSLFSPKYFS